MIDHAKLLKFINYTTRLEGDEKGEAQVFCDRFFQAFGHEGYKEAGAVLEFRVQRKKNSTQFADLLWGDRVLIEMKKKGAKLELHRTQAFDYWWNLRPSSPKYVILCNFEDIYIYNFSIQDEPLDRLKVVDLENRYTALNFLFPVEKKPIFDNNLVDVTRAAADKVSKLFKSLIEKGEQRERVQRFILQSVFAMFAEDMRLLPYGFFREILDKCYEGSNSYDLIGGLFKQMASKERARGGLFKDVEYFNGGLFSVVDPVELTILEIGLLRDAGKENWRKVHPGIFGAIFQNSMDKNEQHAYGAHYTYEADIYKIVYPTIVYPWKKRIKKAETLRDLQILRKELVNFQVLDPACGSGNFLYVAYRELRRIEIEILNKIHTKYGKAAAQRVGVQTLVSPKQFFGMDVNFFATELAKVTLMLAKELSIKEAQTMIETQQLGLGLQMEAALPLDNLDNNICCEDALFTAWPKVDVIIGNPPYQSKNKIKDELGVVYVDKLRTAFPQIPGRADYCVYWFYKAQNELKAGGYAGLVGTNTIRQNFSREGSLDYIIKNGGTIFNAVSSQVWEGEAIVFVSIVCWRKGEFSERKLLYVHDADGAMKEYELEYINSSLSLNFDVSSAKIIRANRFPKIVFQGQTHGHEAFLLPKEEGLALIKKEKKYKEVLKPYLTGDEMLSKIPPGPNRFVIDFTLLDINQASVFLDVFITIQNTVLPVRKEKAEEQMRENKELLENNPKAKLNKHHIQFLNKWWKLSYGREDMLEAISALNRYIACSRVSKRPIFEFVSSEIRPNDAMMVFAFEDDYSFGVIQSSLHILWYQEKCSTLKGDPRYTTESIWDTFPWPQNPTEKATQKVAVAGKVLRDERNNIINQSRKSLRDVYRLMEQPGKNILKDLHEALDNAVMEAYGFSKKKGILIQLLELNSYLSALEDKNEKITGPGLPPIVKDTSKFINEDSIVSSF